MRLRELISFVRQIDRFSNVDQGQGGDEPLVDEPKAPRVVRSPVPPPWVRDAQVTQDRDDLFADTDAQVIKDRGDLFVDLERELSPDDLPPDLREPNPPIDTLAYYLPFHLHESDWGIYLRESGVLVVASILKGSRLAGGDFALIERGREVLLEHERLHFQAEVASARAEVIARLPLYDAYFRDGVAAAHEEALANASAFRSLRGEPAGIRDRVFTWMKHQDPGYRDFDKWVDSGKFRAGCRRAGQHILKTIPRPRASRPEPAEFLFESIGSFKPPIHAVVDVCLASAFRPFPKAHGMRALVYTREHPPPHIHIQIPPGRAYTRYLWPQLEPLNGNPELSSNRRKALDLYLADYGPKIDAKVRAVYPGGAPWVPVPGPAA